MLVKGRVVIVKVSEIVTRSKLEKERSNTMIFPHDIIVFAFKMFEELS